MAVVTHHIGKNFYAYEHYRDGKTVRSKYIGPVDSKGAIRAPHIGKGVDRQPVGTTYQSLRRIYMKSVRRKEMEDAEYAKKTVSAKHKEKPYEPPAKKEYERTRYGKSIVTAKRVEKPVKEKGDIKTIGEVKKEEEASLEKKWGKEDKSKRYTKSPYLKDTEIYREHEGHVDQIVDKKFRNITTAQKYVRENIKPQPDKEIQTQVRYKIKGFGEYSTDVITPKQKKTKYITDKKYVSDKETSFDNIIVDEKGNEVGQFNYDISKKKDSAYLDWIKVEKEYRGKSIADKTVDQFIENMHKKGIKDIQMTSIKSKEKYWEKRGWELIKGHPEEGQMKYVGKK